MPLARATTCYRWPAEKTGGLVKPGEVCRRHDQTPATSGATVPGLPARQLTTQAQRAASQTRGCSKKGTFNKGDIQ